MDFMELLANLYPNKIDDAEIIVSADVETVVSLFKAQGYKVKEVRKVEGGLYCRGVSVDMTGPANPLNVYSSGYCTIVRIRMAQSTISAALRLLATSGPTLYHNSTISGDEGKSVVKDSQGVLPSSDTHYLTAPKLSKAKPAKAKVTVQKAKSTYRGDVKDQGAEDVGERGDANHEGPRAAHPLHAQPGPIEGVGLPKVSPSDELLEQFGDDEDEKEKEVLIDPTYSGESVNSPPMWNLSQPQFGTGTQ